MKKTAQKKNSSTVWVILLAGIVTFFIWRSQADKKMSAQFAPVPMEQTTSHEPSVTAFDSSEEFKQHQESMIQRRKELLKLTIG
ncbi:MAG: hypothetical protein ACOH5I_00225 [Oligoflexus sp.]